MLVGLDAEREREELVCDVHYVDLWGLMRAEVQERMLFWRCSVMKVA